MGTAWIRPQSTEPTDLINRNEERRRFARILDDYFESGGEGARILVTGDRGVGKSILTRAVIRDFAARYPDKAVSIVVNGRGIGYRRFLEELARSLVEEIRPHAQRWRREVSHWLDELLLLANSTQITSTQTTNIARKYGVDASVGVDTGTSGPVTLLGKLSSRFAWEETRTATTGVQRMLAVTDALLHDAIGLMLKRLRAEKDPTSIVVFYDDLDQAFDNRSGEEIEANIQRILELQPCIALAHIRTESMYPNIRRVISEEVPVRPLPTDELMAMLQHRAQQAKNSAVKEAFRATRTPAAFRQLASVTGNALAFLRWSGALLNLWGLSQPDDWREEGNLRRLACEATPTGGIDSALLVELARLVDQCSVHGAGEGCLWEDLVRGGPTVAACPQPTLKDTELDRLRTLGLIVRRNQFAERPVYRLEPTLELLRPSVGEKLRAAV